MERVHRELQEHKRELLVTSIQEGFLEEAGSSLSKLFEHLLNEIRARSMNTLSTTASARKDLRWGDVMAYSSECLETG